MALSGRQAQQRIRRLRQRLPEITENALFAAGNRVTAEMKDRIFFEGKATSGKLLGPYKSANWIALRERLGRQTDNKDLNLTGNMFRDFTLGRQGRDIVVGFIGGKYTSSYRRQLFPGSNAAGSSVLIAKVARYQEQQTGETIFGASQDEIRKAEEDATQITLQLILKTLT